MSELITKIYENPNIYRIDVPLPNNPLRNLNCYVIQDGGETLVIDTGFNREVCKEALLAGFAELGIGNEHVNLFLTHLHADHSGLAFAAMKGRNGKTYISKVDYEYLQKVDQGEYWEKTDEAFIQEGFTREAVEELNGQNPANEYEPERLFDGALVEDGDVISVGKYDFRVIMVPGHTPGQACLYNEEQKILFTADHILFDITPNITFWVDVEDSLGDYLDSLVKIREVDIAVALPSHRKNDMDVYVRIEEIIAHHYERLVETLEAVEKFPNAHGTQVASQLKWSMRGKTWAEFPLFQKWFAIGETLSHLDYLVVRGMVAKNIGETNGYTLLKSIGECELELQEIWKTYEK
ncbi:MBL fold metallo-hydrolase [Chakrabartyella piscis]|uniref:MBL fold metallo-hydrolase n=1 Tax=Chakrabartyella piscis TaxID=2918914 RepID=UPI002958DEB6|nr:MBL fold metallo-hydrolase [Chakrabartyella piscis]